MYFRKIQSIIVYFIFRLFKPSFRYSVERKSNNSRIFIFGSGPSLNELTNNDIEHISKSGDTFGFNSVYNFNKIKFDYYLVREFSSPNYFFKHEPFRTYFSSIFNRTNIIVRKKFSKIIDVNCYLIFHIDKFSGNVILDYKYFNRFFKNKFFYKTNLDRKKYHPFAESYSNISHGNASLLDCIQISSLLGYKEIVLVGVDLNSKKYFYDSQNHSNILDSNHDTLDFLNIAFDSWEPELTNLNINIYVYNPHSILTNRFSIYDKKNN